MNSMIGSNLGSSARDDSTTLRSVAKSLYLAIAFLKECNYKCAYCHPFGESRIRYGENLSKKELLEIIDAAIESGFEVFRFTGGEPTVLPWFSHVLIYTLEKDPCIRVNISTNGSAIEKHLDLYEQYRERICVRVSLDSTDERHKELGFDKILTPSLKRSLEHLSERKIPTRLNMVVTQSNKTEVGNIISLAASLGFEVKLLDLNIQDKYIATHGVAGNTRQLIQIQPLEYWRRNFLDLNELTPTLRQKASSIIEAYNKDGGLGIPMQAFVIDGAVVSVKDATKGTHYHRVECVENCAYFGHECQEGLYAPHISSNMMLHASGCRKLELQWPLKGTNHQQKLQAFEEILRLFSEAELIPAPPEPIRLIINSTSKLTS